MGGPSDAAKSNENAQTAFYKETTQQQETTFGQQQELLSQIRGVTAPIIARGPVQFGFTPEMDALLKSTISDSAARAETNSVNATELAEKQKAGGAQVLPSGASAQIEEDARILGEQSKATNLAQEKLSGYTFGNQLYNNAVSQLSAATGNPTAYTQAATGAGSNATGAINLADSERSNLLQTLLGGAVQGGLQLGTKAAGNLAPGVFG